MFSISYVWLSFLPILLLYKLVNLSVIIQRLVKLTKELVIMARGGNTPKNSKQKYNREQVEEFFRRIKEDIGLQGISKSVYPELIDGLNRYVVAGNYTENGKEYTIEKYTFKDVKRLHGSNIQVRQDMIDIIPLAIPYVSRWRDNPDVRKLYFEIFNRNFFEHSANQATLSLINDGEDAPDFSCKLYGDYLLFRTERDGTISIAFFRFYLHKHDHMRSMGLWLNDAFGFLSTKGWIIKQGREYLALGSIVNRQGEDISGIKSGGGATMLSVLRIADYPYVIEESQDTVHPFTKDESVQQRITMAAVLHCRSTYNQDSSFSRGLLIKCKGVEMEGGGRLQQKDKRYKEIKALQSELANKLGGKIKPKKVASLLAKATNLPAKFFYSNPEKDRFPTGLLTNDPSIVENNERYEFGSTEHYINYDYKKIHKADEIFLDIEQVAKFLFGKKT